MTFRDRAHAGRVLASRLGAYARRSDVVVLGLPRGGVPVAFEVARALQAPLDVCIVRKLGVPGQEELAMGAVAAGGARIMNDELIELLRIPSQAVESIVRTEMVEVERRDRLYRGDRPRIPLREGVAILVDDGLATGSTMRAAIEAVRRQGPTRIVVAVPVAAPETCADLGRAADEIVCVETPEPFWAVGLWYDDFVQVSDEQVRDLLDLAAHEREAAALEELPRI